MQGIQVLSTYLSICKASKLCLLQKKGVIQFVPSILEVLLKGKDTILNTKI